MYRILTENKNADGVRGLLRGLGLDYTIYFGNGSWHGQAENCMLIELDNSSRDVAEVAATLIKGLNDQEAALLQHIPVTSHLIKCQSDTN